MYMTSRSKELFVEARKHMPGGVNSPVRAFGSVGGTPVFFERGSGPYLYDVDGNKYIDFVLSWGPLIAGHAHPQVVDRLIKVLANGTSFGAPTALETELVTKVKSLFPSMEVVRLVNSGTEAAMSAIRLARAVTGRTKIIKFTGNYHGHVDALLVKAGSGVATLGLPDSPGVPASFTAETITVPYNDLDTVRQVFAAHGEDIAAVAVEPVAGNMGFVAPKDGFLQGLRDITTEYGSVLLFDEVMTGFRVAPGGAQERFGLKPDITCLGKVIGGGLPVGAYGGSEAAMRMIAPDGPVYQAGTLSGNPLAVTGGLATLELVSDKSVYDEFERRCEQLGKGLREMAKRHGVPLQFTGFASMAGFFFSDQPVYDFDGVAASDTSFYKQFFHACLERGVYLAPSAFECMFLSTEHSETVLDDALQRMDEAMAAAKG